MHRTVHMLLSASVIALGSTTAFAQETPAPAEQQRAEAADTTATTDAPEGDQAIVVTARKRSEVLQDVPVAVTAVTGDTIEKRGLTQIKDVAQLTPSLNVNSDGVGRVFLAVRGVGTTLVGTVQPGVGIFVDGVYQPNTSYLNNPLVDVDRVEVLRGPQGTLYGKNTLGGALNVITRQPSNRFVARVGGSYAGPDNAWDAYGSVSGPIIEDKLQVKVAAAHRQQDGFIRNTLLDTDANSLNMDTLTATVRAAPTEGVVLTVNGYYEWVKGGQIPYSHIDGPTDYQRTVELNAKNTQFFHYKGVNAKLEVEAGTDTNITLIGAYDERDGHTPDLDIDFNSVDIGRQESRDKLKTASAELRFDSEWSSQFSTLIGFYYSHETLDGEGLGVVRVVHPIFGPITQVNGTEDSREGDSYAAFANAFWKPMEDLEVALGLRLDHETRTAGGALGSTILLGLHDLDEVSPVPLTEIDEVSIESTKLLPKLTVTKHWNDEVMTYASISKGFRGGGFNGPTAPFRTYKGDSVWTYEIGSKYLSADRKLSVAGAIFYNDYKDYIGLNQFVLGTNGSAVTVDLNTGDVTSYGAEVEFAYHPTKAWTLTGGGSYVHARITDSDIYTETTGKVLASKRLPFQPDWTFNINSDYVVPLGTGELTLTAGAVAKGSRIGASISETRAPVLKSYVLLNGAITYAFDNIEVGAFVNNALNKKYYDSFIEKTTLENVFGPGPLASDLGIMGDKRRYGVRARMRF
ncbi:TonB-dependent receptor [Sphingomonas sp. RB56-2]|uniref:TonB-dependent receptor n=1 Tax=Sphingomonas brevis TaxID=2908206 RepID=A0ABT0S5Z1_9SPHN|nr:TonB-dependent receptor [Sphingomonas brevis]MCL6739801.1 TonB-dependent receptor [Sphingomonas brevis]